MTPVARPTPPYNWQAGGSPVAQSASKNDAVDKFLDKVVVKGPCRDTSGFQLQYVHVADFRLTWVERGDEIHLIPYSDGVREQLCFVFSSLAEEAFLVTIQPTRASVNAQVYTNIPEWRGKRTIEYVKELERQRKAGSTKLSRYVAPQRLGGEMGAQVRLRVDSRRQVDGWWVYITVTPISRGSGRHQ